MSEVMFADGRTQRFKIPTVKSEDKPANLIAVAFEATYEPGEIVDPRDTSPESLWGELIDWIADLWREEGGKPTRVHTERSSTPERFWRVIYDRLTRGGTHWLFAHHLYPFLCVAKFFDEVDKGELSISLSPEDNGGTLDFGRKRRRQGLLICDNPPTLVICNRKGGGVLKMLDLANYGFSPQWSATATLEQKIVFTTGDIRRLVAFTENNGLGALQHTAAAQGFYYYRKSHMSWPIEVHPYKMALELERDASYGGRCECARIGKLPCHVYHLDVNAQYTSMAAVQDFPAEFLGYNEEVPCKEIGDLLAGGGAIADVTVRIVEPVAPIRTNERVLFPTGVFRTVLCTPELQLVAQTGEILACHRLALYGMGPLFQSFAASMQSLKTMAMALRNDNLVSLVKSMANGMYGKWGQRSRRWVSDYDQKNTERWESWWQPHPKTEDPVPWRAIAGLVQYQDQERESKLACPSISAFMTSYGRVNLFTLIEAAGLDNVYYWDTDSLMVNAHGLDNLECARMLHADACGKLKLREESDDVEIFGVKHYRFGDRYVCSGVSTATDQRLHGAIKIAEHASFDAGLWHRERGVARKIVRKRGRTRKYNQGRVLATGQVVPFNFTSRKEGPTDGV